MSLAQKQKQLPAPYGHDSSNWWAISLETDYRKFDAMKCVEILTSYSCHAPALPKIVSCLNHSGRYDCLLQYGWFSSPNHQKGCIDSLKAAGVTLTVLGYRLSGEIITMTEVSQ